MRCESVASSFVNCVFDHAEQLLQFRDDFPPEDVAFAFNSLVSLGANHGILVLQLSTHLTKVRD